MVAVILVDDNEALLRFSCMVLSQAMPDARVLPAASCSEARLVAARTDLDVALVDHKLPDGCGVELINELRRLHPGLPAIIASGDITEELYELLRAGFVQDTLAKPYGTEAMTSAVRGALEAQPQSRRARTCKASVETEPWPQKGSQGPDWHLLKNRMSAAMAGLRAFSCDLRAVGKDPLSVDRIINEYEPRLLSILRDMARQLNNAQRAERELSTEHPDASRRPRDGS